MIFKPWIVIGQRVLVTTASFVISGRIELVASDGLYFVAGAHIQGDLFSGETRFRSFVPNSAILRIDEEDE